MLSCQVSIKSFGVDEFRIIHGGGGSTMHDVFEYLEWRGDIPFDTLGPVNADYAVFCSLSYVPFDGIVEGFATDGGSSSKRNISDPGQISGAADATGTGDVIGGFIGLDIAAQKVIDIAGQPGHTVRFHLEDDLKLLERVKETERFGRIMIGGYKDIFDQNMQEQFCAMTFVLPGGDAVVAFRGTDGTIIGWKEDFNMGFMDELPSQKDAVRYLNLASQMVEGKIYVCGHSKGGNLAMFAAAFADRAVQDRIVAVRSLDGPGFKKQTVNTPGFLRVIDRMETFMPQSSIVGLVLEHAETNHVIHSFAKGSKQHNIYSWSISGGIFTEEAGLSESSIRANKAINKWIEKMSDEDRMKLTDGIFELVSQTEAETLEELFEPKNLFSVMKKIGKLDDKTKELIGETGRIIMNAYREKSSFSQ